MTELTYCTFCKRPHHFGYDEIGAQVELLSCKKGIEPVKEPITSEEAAKQIAAGEIYIWENHDKFRTIAGEEGEPQRVQLARAYLALAERLEREQGEGFTVAEIRILYQAIRDRMQSTERELGYECQHLRDLLRKIDFMKQQPDIQPRGAAK